MAKLNAVLPFEIAQLRADLVVATMAHMQQQELHDRSHPDRQKTKAEYLSAHDAWKATVRFN